MKIKGRELLKDFTNSLGWSEDLKTLPRNQRDMYLDQIFKIYQFMGEIYFS